MKTYRKKVICEVIALCLTIILTSCGVNNSQKANQGKLVLKFSILESEEHPQGIMLSTFKRRVEELSNGKIECQAYYNGSLLSQQAEIQGVCDGSLEMTVITMQATEEYYHPATTLCSTFLFDNYEHMRRVMDSSIGDDIFQGMLEESPFVPVGFFYNGSRQLNLRTSTEVKTPEDLQNTILRMPSGEEWVFAGESLGAKVTGMAYGEVYAALQNGTIDAQDNPLAADKTMKFYEVTNQLCLTSHIVDVELVAFNKAIWNELSTEQQEWILQAMDEAINACDTANIQMEQELVQFFKNEGLVITEPDREAFKKYSYDYYMSNGLTEKWDMDLYEKIKAMSN